MGKGSKKSLSKDPYLFHDDDYQIKWLLVIMVL